MWHKSEIVRDQPLVTLSTKTTVKHACQCMRDRRAGAALATDKDHRLVGIFTGRDALYRVGAYLNHERGEEH
jgi:CBS domain-containing protein